MYVYEQKYKKIKKPNCKFATSLYLGQPSEDNQLYAVLIKNGNKKKQTAKHQPKLTKKQITEENEL